MGDPVQLTDRVGRRLKLRDLHVLMTVVQTGSMGKAAARLNTVQPAISRSIAELEQTLGVSLLERRRQGVEPTPYGRALLDCGIAVFDDLRLGMKTIESLADPTAGEVRIGSIIPLAASFVSAVIDRLSRRYPRVVFHVLAGQTEELQRDLHERKVDFLISPWYGHFVVSQAAFELLYEDPYVIVAGTQHPLARRRRIELAELTKQAWVLPPPDMVLGAVALDVFHASGLEYPRATVITGPGEVRIPLLTTGRFLTIFLASLLRFPSRRPELKALPVELPVARVPIGIVTLKNRMLSPAAKLFIEAAREVAKPLAKRES